MENEFLLIVEKASIQVTRTRDQEEGHVGRRGRGPVRENVPKQLTKMFQICFERFHAVVLAHRILLSHFQRTKRTYKGQWIMLHMKLTIMLFVCLAPYTLYGMSDVWVAIQQVVSPILLAHGYYSG